MRKKSNGASSTGTAQAAADLGGVLSVDDLDHVVGGTGPAAPPNKPVEDLHGAQAHLVADQVALTTAAAAVAQAQQTQSAHAAGYNNAQHLFADAQAGLTHANDVLAKDTSALNDASQQMHAADDRVSATAAQLDAARQVQCTDQHDLEVITGKFNAHGSYANALARTVDMENTTIHALRDLITHMPDVEEAARKQDQQAHDMMQQLSRQQQQQQGIMALQEALAQVGLGPVVTGIGLLSGLFAGAPGSGSVADQLHQAMAPDIKAQMLDALAHLPAHGKSGIDDQGNYTIDGYTLDMAIGDRKFGLATQIAQNLLTAFEQRLPHDSASLQTEREVTNRLFDEYNRLINAVDADTYKVEQLEQRLAQEKAADRGLHDSVARAEQQVARDQHVVQDAKVAFVREQAHFATAQREHTEDVSRLDAARAAEAKAADAVNKDEAAVATAAAAVALQSHSASDALHTVEGQLAADQAALSRAAAATGIAPTDHVGLAVALDNAGHTLTAAQSELAQAKAAAAGDHGFDPAQLRNTLTHLDADRQALAVGMQVMSADKAALGRTQGQLHDAQSVQSHDAQVLADHRNALAVAEQLLQAAHDRAVVADNMAQGKSFLIRHSMDAQIAEAAAQEQAARADVSRLRETVAKDQAAYDASTARVNGINRSIAEANDRIAADQRNVDSLKANIAREESDVARLTVAQQHYDRVVSAQQAVDAAQGKVNLIRSEISLASAVDVDLQERQILQRQVPVKPAGATRTG